MLGRATFMSVSHKVLCSKEPCTWFKCFLVTILRLLIILFLHLCFVSEVQWDSGACIRRKFMSCECLPFLATPSTYSLPNVPWAQNSDEPSLHPRGSAGTLKSSTREGCWVYDWVNGMLKVLRSFIFHSNQNLLCTQKGDNDFWRNTNDQGTLSYPFLLLLISVLTSTYAEMMT